MSSNFQLSGNFNIISDKNVPGDEANKLTVFHNYLDERIGEIEKRILSKNRSVFDFVDMAVIIGTLANLTNLKNGGETERYIVFVRDELVPSSEQEREMIATAFYSLMRCSLVHELSLAGHNIPAKRKTALKSASVILTHDASIDGSWYSVDRSAKQVVLYAHELLTQTKTIVSKCFQPNNPHELIIRNKLQTKGIDVIAIKS